MQVSNNLQSQQALNASLTVRGSAPSEQQQANHKCEHGSCKRVSQRGQGLGVLRQELQTNNKVFFKASQSASQSAYASSTTSSSEVADEALSTAKRLAAQAPGETSRAIAAFRARMQQSASAAREAVQAPAEKKDVDSAVAKIDEGLEKLEADAKANDKANQTSSASVLDINTKTKQRSFIKIRTQEGDLVKLSLRRVDQMSAKDVAETNGSESKSSTEVSVSSRSRMMLKVDGDLNEAEMAAIQGVFAQAETIANQFFGGDMQAALGAAEGFEFDAEQLSRVNMRFRMRQVSSASYTERSQVSQPALVEPTVVDDSGPKLSPATPEPVAVAAPPKSDPIGDTIAPPPVVEETAADVEPVVATPVADAAQDVAAPTTGLASLWNVLGAFLQSASEGFQSENTSTSIKFHYSQEFKLELLKSVVNTVADEGLSDSVAEQIDSYLEVDKEVA